MPLVGGGRLSAALAGNDRKGQAGSYAKIRALSDGGFELRKFPIFWKTLKSKCRRQSIRVTLYGCTACDMQAKESMLICQQHFVPYSHLGQNIPAALYMHNVIAAILPLWSMRPLLQKYIAEFSPC